MTPCCGKRLDSGRILRCFVAQSVHALRVAMSVHGCCTLKHGTLNAVLVRFLCYSDTICRVAVS